MVKAISDRKLKYRAKMEDYLASYKNILVVSVDNVGSNQLQQVRGDLRGRAEVLLGKNTIMRKVIREAAPENPKLEKLMPYIYGNMGFVFTNDDLTEIRDKIVSNQVPAAAKAGATAPIDVIIPAGATGLDPAQTSFFQALNILTKIAKGSIEIINDVHLIKKGDRVGPSEVALLNKLNKKPFFYGVQVNTVYENGSIYPASILDLSDDDILGRFFKGVQRIAALSLRIGYPTAASLPHMLANAWSKIASIAVATDITFKEIAPIKEYLENPDAFVAEAPAAAAASTEEAKEEAKEEPKDDSDSDMGVGLFGDEED